MSITAIAACLSLAPAVIGGVDEPGFDYVGNSYWQPKAGEWQLSGSCVGIAKNWAIGVRHAGGQRLVIDGKTYDVVNEIRNQGSDLTLFKLKQPLPVWAKIDYSDAEKFVGRSVKIVSCGVGGRIEGVSPMATSGTEGKRRSGNVKVSMTSVQRLNWNGNPLASQCLGYQLAPGGVHMGSRDSGGGWFVQDGKDWKLVALCAYTSRSPVGGFGVHLGTYRDWIEKTMASN